MSSSSGVAFGEKKEERCIYITNKMAERCIMWIPKDMYKHLGKKQ